MVKIIEKISKAIDKITMESGRRPDELYIHPDKAQELGGITEIHGVKVCVPVWSDLEMLALFTGVSVHSDAFWNKESVYLVHSKRTEDTFLSILPADARPGS